MGEKNLHWIERVWWLISFAISFVLCGILIYQIHLRWISAPAIISFSNEATPVSDIPFPTITVCSEDKLGNVNYTYIFDQLDEENDYKNIHLSEKDVERMYALSAFCQPPMYLEEYVKFKNMSIDRNIVPYLDELIPTIPEVFPNCNLAAGKAVECASILSKTLTDEGLCYTFNYLDSSQIYYEDKLADDFPRLKPFEGKYLDRSDKVTYPYRMRNAGIGWWKFKSIRNNRMIKLTMFNVVFSSTTRFIALH